MALLETMTDVAGLELRTDQLVLRPFTENDLDRLVDLIGDYEVSKWLTRVPWPYRQDHAAEWLRHCRSDNDDFNLVLDSGDGLIGAVGLSDTKAGLNLGYWLGRPWWGRGLMSEAVARFVECVFDEMDVDSIVSSVFDHNTASLRLQERLGFKIVGKDVEYSLARGHDVPGIITRLTREDFETWREPGVDTSLIVDDF